MKLHKRNCVGAITSAKTKPRSGNSSLLKMRYPCLLPRISNPARQRSGSHTLSTAKRTDYSVRQICETLGFTRSNFYYRPKPGPCEAALRDEIERFAPLYPTDGYRRITQLLVRSGYTIGGKRVARLMKSANLSVAVKRVCQIEFQRQNLF